MKAKKLLTTVISATLTMALTFSACPMNQVFAAVNQKKQYIVIPKEGYFQTIRSQFQDKLSEYLPTITNALSGRTLLLDLTAFEAWSLERLTGVAAVSEDIDVIACTDETGGEITPEWNMQMIHADAAPQTVSGEKVKVAIIDSGIDDTEDIAVQERKNFVPSEEEVYPCYDDTTGHGTSIAGIIASTGVEAGCAGVNPNAPFPKE